jgi:release factor glutamine methyltransferase
MSKPKSVFFRGGEFRVYPDVYEPAEDTFLLADNLDVFPGERVLELGTGCGLLAVLAAEAGGRVVATDVNPSAIECARENAISHWVMDRVDLRLGDLFEPVQGERFDLIIFNPPYLPVRSGEEIGSPLDMAWEGGPDGRSIIDRFLIGLSGHLNLNGRAMFVQSSLSDIPKTLRSLESSRFQVEIQRKKLFFEELCLLRCSKVKQGGETHH